MPVELLEMFGYQGHTVSVHLKTGLSKWLTVRAYYSDNQPVNDITYFVHQRDRAYWFAQGEDPSTTWLRKRV